MELNPGDTLDFTLANGQTRKLRLLETYASVEQSNLPSLPEPGPLAKVILRMSCKIEVDGHIIALNRWVGNQDSFYQPWNFFGLHLWFDATTKIFDHLTENHGPCKPRKEARFAIQDATLRICPTLLHPWCPLPSPTLRIEDCYQGSDCWLGPYFGIDAHGGLDINHPAGTPIWTPFAIDQQAYFNSLANGDNNNRWRGTKSWPDGSLWTIQVHHILRLLAPENQPLDAGTHLADAAGVRVGSYEHSHFVFGITEPNAAESEKILLDPWILFWQMYQDRALTQR